jgi:molecular chaperone GrpE
MSKKNKAQELEDIISEEQLQQEAADKHEDRDSAEAEPKEELSAEERHEAELAKERDKFLRLFAEFENYKKRTSRERMELFKTAGQEVIGSLLPVLDDFERALKEIFKSPDKELFIGVELIDIKLRETLKSKGLNEIEVKVGDTFDPDLHDAITQVPAPEENLKGKIIDVVEKGFRLGEKVIRHPKVVVGN